MFNIAFLRNFPAGVFVGTFFTLMLCAALDADISDDLTKYYSFIGSALVGLLAASLALSGVLANMNLQAEQRRHERKRRLLSAKALLPIALSEMCEVARKGVANSWRDRPGGPIVSRAEFDRQSLEDIRLSDEIVSVFRDIVEFDDEETAAIRIQGILREYQVFAARWRSHISDQDNLMTPDDSEIAQRTTAWAYLYALAESAFDYARGETTKVENDVTEAEISHALSASRCFVHHQDEFSEAIGLYARHHDRRFG